MGPTLRVEPIRAIEELVVTRSAAHQCDLSDTRPGHPGKARDARGRAPQSPGYTSIRRTPGFVTSLQGGVLEGFEDRGIQMGARSQLDSPGGGYNE